MSRSKQREATAGFDALRLGLSLLILWSHTSWLQQAAAHAGAPEGHHVRSAFRVVSAMAVPMFFALSGYLVTGSALRVHNPRVFLLHRLLRILPALIVEVTLSAIVIGAAFTDLPLSLYFSDPDFRAYFLNVFGLVHFHLPGVFARNPLPDIVNINLWTLPAEFYGYLVMTAAMLAPWLLPVASRRFRALAPIATVLVYAYFVVCGGEALNGENFKIRPLVWIFLAGACFRLYRDQIPLRFWLFAVALATAIALLLRLSTLIFARPFIVYVTAYLGALDFPMPRFLRKNDYSHGVYLYGFPIAQSLAAAFPALVASKFGFRIAAIGLTLAFAALSWHGIEARALRLKGWLAAPRPLPTPPGPRYFSHF
jgi:peptidoglycan/LPS O-acetylase OafA/YrhL